MRIGSRILLLIVTNMAILMVATLVINLLGLPPYLHDATGLNYQTLLIFAAVLGFGGAFFSLAISKWLAKTTMRVKVIERPANEAEAWLVRTVTHLARQAGIHTPEIGIYDSPDMNAFATGARRNASLVAVSTGLLRGMSREEAEAVLGHEIAHCANGDMVTMTLLQGVLNTFVIFLSRVVGFFVDRVLLRNERGYGIGYFVTVIVTQIALGILASIIVAAFSRRREYRADAGAAKLVGPRPMIGALNALKRVQGPALMPESMQAFGIRGGRGRFHALFMTHPPLDARIAKLKALGG
jgi:heat shock protein HtpX